MAVIKGREIRKSRAIMGENQDVVTSNVDNTTFSMTSLS